MRMPVHKTHVLLSLLFTILFVDDEHLPQQSDDCKLDHSLDFKSTPYRLSRFT